jgi:hypothetical protein
MLYVLRFIYSTCPETIRHEVSALISLGSLP